MNVCEGPRSRFRWLPPVAMAILLLVSRQRVLAFVATGSVGSIDYRVMAPDWICRGEVVSLLIVVSVDDRPGAVEHELVAILNPPESGFDGLPGTGLEGMQERRMMLAPGDVKRFSFTGWKARVDADLARFTFELRLESPRETRSVDLRIPVDTIRGAAVPEGIWSILVPVAISLLALPVFALILRRSGSPGAWKTAVDLEILPAREPWWERVDDAG